MLCLINCRWFFPVLFCCLFCTNLFLSPHLCLAPSLELVCQSALKPVITTTDPGPVLKMYAPFILRADIYRNTIFLFCECCFCHWFDNFPAWASCAARRYCISLTSRSSWFCSSLSISSHSCCSPGKFQTAEASVMFWGVSLSAITSRWAQNVKVKMDCEQIICCWPGTITTTHHTWPQYRHWWSFVLVLPRSGVRLVL